MDFLILTRFIQLIVYLWATDTIEINSHVSSNEQCGVEIILQGLTHSDNYDSSIVKRGEFPWNAVLMRRSSKNRDKWKYFCGGTLINKDTVVTAAHCFLGKYQTSLRKIEDLKVILGAYNISDTAESYRKEFEIFDLLIHSGWNANEFRYTHDIALLKLKTDVENFTPMIRPICMKKSKEISDINLGMVAGFGEFSGTRGLASEIPLKVNLPIISHSEWTLKNWKLAQAYWKESFCAGSETAGVCPGDSGSGFIVELNKRYYLRGLVSVNVMEKDEDCTHHSYAFYTDVLEYIDDFIMPFANLEKSVWTNLFGIRKEGANLSYEKSKIKDESLFSEINRKSSPHSIENCGEQLLSEGLVHNANSIDAFVRRGELPWRAVLMRKRIKKGGKAEWTHWCGGTLISSNIVLTAAHCIHRKASQSPLGAENLKILLGAYSIKDTDDRHKREREVINILIHGGWNPDDQFSFADDIAMIILQNEIKLFSPMIRPICLMKSQEISDIMVGTVAGYGEFNETRRITPDVPLKAELKIIPRLKWIYSKYRKLSIGAWKESFVAGSETAGICPGDSGSGFYVKSNGKFYLRGIVSLMFLGGDYSCTHNNFALYTDVPKYLDSFIYPVLKLSAASRNHLRGLNPNYKPSKV